MAPIARQVSTKKVSVNQSMLEVPILHGFLARFAEQVPQLLAESHDGFGAVLILDNLTKLVIEASERGTIGRPMPRGVILARVVQKIKLHDDFHPRSPSR